MCALLLFCCVQCRFAFLFHSITFFVYTREYIFIYIECSRTNHWPSHSIRVHDIIYSIITSYQTFFPALFPVNFHCSWVFSFAFACWLALLNDLGLLVCMYFYLVGWFGCFFFVFWAHTIISRSAFFSSKYLSCVPFQCDWVRLRMHEKHARSMLVFGSCIRFL